MDTPEQSQQLAELHGSTVEQAGPYIALLAAWIAMCGSLFFSQVFGWPPCDLCWYQRILMYPLALVLAVGILRGDRGLYLYVLPLSVLGASVSFYHYLLIKTDLFPPFICFSSAPCEVDYIDIFGFINIPFLALTAFLIISAMMAVMALTPAPESPPPSRRVIVPGIIVAVVATFVALAQIV